MASKLIYVIKNKNKYEKEERLRRQAEIDELKSEGKFRVALNKDIELLRTLMEDPGVASIDVSIEDDELTHFNKALYYEEMKEFTWQQGNRPELFRCRRKDIDL